MNYLFDVAGVTVTRTLFRVLTFEKVRVDGLLKRGEWSRTDGGVAISSELAGILGLMVMLGGFFASGLFLRAIVELFR
jgi:hypothetical protein